jgi:hypothetical protein
MRPRPRPARRVRPRPGRRLRPAPSVIVSPGCQLMIHFGDLRARVGAEGSGAAPSVRPSVPAGTERVAVREMRRDSVPRHPDRHGRIPRRPGVVADRLLLLVLVLLRCRVLGVRSRDGDQDGRGDARHSERRCEPPSASVLPHESPPDVVRRRRQSTAIRGDFKTVSTPSTTVGGSAGVASGRLSVKVKLIPSYLQPQTSILEPRASPPAVRLLMHDSTPFCPMESATWGAERRRASDTCRHVRDREP